MPINWISLEKDPYVYLDKKTKTFVKSVLDKANKAYHNGKAIISDDLYDIILEFFEDKFGPYNKIGAPVKHEAKKVKLPIHMGSMDKVKDEKTVNNWLKKYSGPFMLSDKLDGISLLAVYDKSNTKPLLYTRGDGSYGQDVSYLTTYMDFPVLAVEQLTIFRGECVISKSNWKHFEKEYSNPRNAVSGLISSDKKVKPELLAKIDFIVFDVVVEGYPMTFSDQFKFAKDNTFNVVQHKSITSVSKDILSTYLQDRRSKGNHEIDGIILADDSKPYENPKSGNPKYAIAFKMILGDQIAETIVKGVEWKVSKDGLIKPVILIKTVKVGGANISRVTGHNLRYIEEHGIGAGAHILIIRSGDVIPKVHEVLTVAKYIDYPNEYDWDWNDNHVEAVLVNKKGNKEIIVKSLLYFVEKIGVKELKKSTITKIHETLGISTIPQLLAITKEDFLKLDGIKEKSAEKMYSNLKTAYMNASIPALVAGGNVFGAGIGVRRIEELFDIMPKFCLEANTKSKIQTILSDAPGFGPKLINTIADNYEQCHDYIKSLPKRKISIKTLKKISLKAKKDVAAKYPINRNIKGCQYVFSGFRNDDLEKAIKTAGGDVKTGISKKINVLVVNTDKETGKVLKAKELGVKILLLDDFISYLKESK